MSDQLIGAMVWIVPNSTLLFNLGGSSFNIRTSSLKDVMKWSTSNMSWNSLQIKNAVNTNHHVFFRKKNSVIWKTKNKIIEWTHLGSAQKEVLSSSGTIRVTFKYLAIATISHICNKNRQRTKEKKNTWQNHPTSQIHNCLN